MIRNDTHEVRIDRDRGLVVKRFRSAHRGEPVREWTALQLLARLAPGLAPAPVSADLDSAFPVITMSLLVLGDDPDVVRVHALAAAWIESRALERHSNAGRYAVLGHGDPCLANYLWDGDRIRLIDFEDSGPSDRAFELAILTEHISAWSDACLDADDFLALFDLTRAEKTRVQDFRRLAALFWLIMLRPGSSSSIRNPPGTLKRQADRLLGLLA